jgi:hypothetical protein
MPWVKAYQDEALTTREAFDKLTLDDLRPLAELFSAGPPKRKSDLVPLVAEPLLDPARLRELYTRLDTLSQNAVRMAVHAPSGRLNQEKFRARFGTGVRFNTGEPNRSYYSYSYAEREKIKPTLLRLFFPRMDTLPTDLRTLLLEFVPPLEPFAIPTLDTLPEFQIIRETTWGRGKETTKEREEPIRIRETAEPAATDLHNVLRLVEAGKLRVTDKKLLPTEATRNSVANVLRDGDYYSADDAEDLEDDPAHDLGIQAYAWPLLLQAGGLAEKSKDSLKLTSAGMKALEQAPKDVLRKLWKSWLSTRLFDEFARIEAIRGQGKARMSAAAGRRAVLVEALAQCPVGRWFTVEEFFRYLRATGQSFTLAHSVEYLYIAEHEYGNLSYSDNHAWEQLQGRYILAFLFEYAATLGVLDVGYVLPQDFRKDYRTRWGSDDLSCLSRYDGLTYLRINPFGAWIFGLAETYQPAPPKRVELLRVLPNLDLVATRELPVADRLVLDRFAERASEGVWKLSAAKMTAVLEQGGRVEELERYLTVRTTGELPPNVVMFLADVRNKATRLADGGAARIIVCADGFIAAELAAERTLKGICQRAGDRMIVVRDADLEKVRKVVRKLGYVWPMPSG